MSMGQSKKLSDEEAARIIEDEMPQYQVVNRPASDARIANDAAQAKPEIVARDVKVWKQKISGARSTRDTATSSLADEAAHGLSDRDDVDLYELFLGKKRPSDDPVGGSGDANDEDDPGSEDESQAKIIVVKRKDASDARDDVTSEPKGVVVDGKTRKIIGFQG